MQFQEESHLPGVPSPRLGDSSTDSEHRGPPQVPGPCHSRVTCGRCRLGLGSAPSATTQVESPVPGTQGAQESQLLQKSSKEKRFTVQGQCSSLLTPKETGSAFPRRAPAAASSMADTRSPSKRAAEVSSLRSPSPCCTADHALTLWSPWFPDT